jgi:anti-sigma factor RsiW
MVVNCEHVWSEVSNYLDDEVTPELRAAMEEHLRTCKHCAAVMAGTSNVIQLYGDQRLLEMPDGFSERLEQRLKTRLSGPTEPMLVQQRRTPASEINLAWTRRGFLGWIGAAAATVLLAGIFEMNKSSNSRQTSLLSEHAQPATGVPPDMAVVVSTAGKIFHRPGCTFILDKDKTQTMTAREAIRAGFTPCIRCMKKYLIQGVAPPSESV